MPKKPAARKARISDGETFAETPRILSPEEKHRLILAHTASRPPRDPVQRATMWVGFAVAVLAVAGGWWISAGHAVRSGLSENSRSFRDMAKTLDQFTQDVQTNPLIQQADLGSPTSGASASGVPDLLKAVLEGTDKGYARDDLLAPSVSASSSAVTETEASSTEPRMHLDTDGLTPESQP